MKQLGIAIILVVELMLGACGGGNSTNANNINGTWASTLTSSPNTPPVLTFTTSLSQMSGTAVSVTNLNFTTATPCFVSGGTETGGFTLSGNFNGNVTGSFQMTIQSGAPSGNTLTLQGSAKNNVITGTWVLTGVTAGCTGSGNFTMTKM
jgi:hypothetical protein